MAGSTSWEVGDQLAVGRGGHPILRPVATTAAVSAIVGSSVLLPQLGPNLAPVDPLLVGVIFLGMALSPTAVDTPPKQVLRAIAPWLALIAASSVLALTTAGVTPWAIVSLGKSVFAIALFVGAYALFWSSGVDSRALVFATGLAIVVVTGGLLATWEPPVRASGTFYHPNYPGHFLAMALIVWWASARYLPRTRAVVAVVGLGGMLLTSSFGAIIMLLAACLPRALVWVRRRPWMVPGATAAILLGLFLVEIPAPEERQADVEVTETLNASRFQKSQDGRLDLWANALEAVVHHPLGLGPMGFRNSPEFSAKDVSDDGRLAHNLYISYLVDRGPLGLLALLGLGFALWRHAPRGGSARPLLLAIAASNLVRETSHYRHMWLFLAVALTLDHAAEARHRGRAS